MDSRSVVCIIMVAKSELPIFLVFTAFLFSTALKMSMVSLFAEGLKVAGLADVAGI